MSNAIWVWAWASPKPKYNENCQFGYQKCQPLPKIAILWITFHIISIFGVIFGQNLGFWHPGVTIYKVPLNCYAIDVEEIPSRFILNAFSITFCYQISKNGKLLSQYQYFGSFLVEHWIFDPLEWGLGVRGGMKLFLVTCLNRLTLKA